VRFAAKGSERRNRQNSRNVRNALESTKKSSFYIQHDPGSHMDRRKMKKHILHTALDSYLGFFEGKNRSQAEYHVAMALDLDPLAKISQASYYRFLDVLRDMVENAESKLDS